MNKKVKKKKLNIGKVLIFTVIILVFSSLIILISKMPVLGYYISGNTYYTDSEILKITGLDKYPSYLLTTSVRVNSRAKKEELIDNIKIKKTLLGKFKVIVTEKKILFYNQNTKKSITDDMNEISFYDKNSPVLINDIPNEKIYSNFISKMSKIDKDVINNISEIKYDPNEIDNERFLVSMNDGNYIYLTISKFIKINDYMKISNTLGNKNGILYLDYGNYFVPFE